MKLYRLRINRNYLFVKNNDDDDDEDSNEYKLTSVNMCFLISVRIV